MNAVDTIKDVREAEHQILAGYTTMGAGINLLASLARTVAMDRDAVERSFLQLCSNVHNALENAGIPRSPDDPDLQLELRLKMLVTMGEQHRNLAEARLGIIQRCHSILDENGINGDGKNYLILPERIEMLLAQYNELLKFRNDVLAE